MIVMEEFEFEESAAAPVPQQPDYLTVQTRHEKPRALAEKSMRPAMTVRTSLDAYYDQADQMLEIRDLTRDDAEEDGHVFGIEECYDQSYSGSGL